MVDGEVRRGFLDGHRELKDLAGLLGLETSTREHREHCEAHLERYPADRVAQDFFWRQPPYVRECVMRYWDPNDRLGKNDPYFSQYYTHLIKRVREDLGRPSS